MVVGIGLYLLLWKADLLSVVFQMSYIQDAVIIIIACGGAIMLFAVFGLIANRLSNFGSYHFLAVVRTPHYWRDVTAHGTSDRWHSQKKIGGRLGEWERGRWKRQNRNGKVAPPQPIVVSASAAIPERQFPG